jgi:hypothetical protein
MVDVIAHAKAALDVLGYARTGPQLGRESGSQRAPEQLFFQSPALARGEFQRPSAGRDSFQRRPAAQPPVMLPAAYAARINIQPARDFGLRNSLFKQLNGALPFTL